MEFLTFLGRPVQSEPGFIVRPIAWLFGTILDFCFNIVYWLTPNNSLGLAIILLTIVAMTLMLPLNIRSQKSMLKMQALNPEIEKIKAKYGNKNDAETKQKISAETQALWAKHKVNPLGSCLPMLIQMPLFFALLYLMGQSYLYIDTLTELYYDMSVAIQAVPNFTEIIYPLARPHIPNDWYYTNGGMLRAMFSNLIEQGHAPEAAMQAALAQLGTTDVIVLGLPDHLSRVLDRFTMESWNTLFAQIEAYHPNYLPPIQALYDRMQSIEVFMGISLKDNSGLRFPGIFIPILSVITMMATTWLSQQINQAKDPQQKMMQTIMMTVMPFVMGAVTVNFAAGVGLYWVASNTYRFVQQLIMNKKMGVPFRLPFVKKEA